ncbi:MAG: hypothetical protein GXO82_01505, partial [Chlorobi bacterium]|nr:hypothetical protein [Chlorobiota bacterium]
MPTVFLSEEYAGVTHASLRLTFYDTTGAREFALRRDGALIMEGVMQTGDTVLVDTALLPARAYTYRAYRLRDGAVRDSSAPLLVTTMDTTSHDFTWEITYLGDGQSYLKDVFAISDTDVWAVGEIYLRDSTGGLNKKYNAAHWNGREWKLHAIQNPVCGSQYTLVTPLVAVFGFSSNDIWFTNGGMLQHYNGKEFKADCSIVPFLKGATTKIWGRSSSDLYFVGTNGSITHYDGQKFERQESGTDEVLVDVFGGYGDEVYACGGEFSGTVLMKSGGLWRVVDSLSNPRIGRWTLWAAKDFFAVGGLDLRYIDLGYSDILQTPPREVLEGGLGAGLPIVTTSIRGSSRE